MGIIKVLIVALAMACAGPWAWSISPFHSTLKIGEIRVKVDSEVRGDRADTQAEVLECMTVQLLAAKEFALEHQKLAHDWFRAKKSANGVEPFRLSILVSEGLREAGRSETWSAEGLSIQLSASTCEALSSSEIEARVRSRIGQKTGARSLPIKSDPLRKPERPYSGTGDGRLESALQAFHQAQR